MCFKKIRSFIDYVYIVIRNYYSNINVLIHNYTFYVPGEHELLRGERSLQPRILDFKIRSPYTCYDITVRSKAPQTCRSKVLRKLVKIVDLLLLAIFFQVCILLNTQIKCIVGICNYYFYYPNNNIYADHGSEHSNVYK